MSEQRAGAGLPRDRPTWYFAATLPVKIPRCTRCGGPALARANRVATVAAVSEPTGPPPGATVFSHRDCSIAPVEVPIRLTADHDLGRVVELEGAPFIVTRVTFIAASETVPAHWLVLGVREHEVDELGGRLTGDVCFDRQQAPGSRNDRSSRE